MKHIPILFSTEMEMVKAILEGRKTQTRRVVKPLSDPEIEPSPVPRSLQNENDWGKWYWENSDGETIMKPNPYGQPGDVLWVREALNKGQNGQFHYKADEMGPLDEVKWKPSIHMPKSACRLFLKVNNIRVEKLQDISDTDAISEGVLTLGDTFKKIHFPGYKHQYEEWEKRKNAGVIEKPPLGPSPKTLFSALWQSINGSASWEANPWVWVIEFKQCEKPENFLS